MLSKIINGFRGVGNMGGSVSNLKNGELEDWKVGIYFADSSKRA
jgi:hypothetical protein